MTNISWALKVRKYDDGAKDKDLFTAITFIFQPWWTHKQTNRTVERLFNVSIVTPQGCVITQIGNQLSNYSLVFRIGMSSSLLWQTVSARFCLHWFLSFACHCWHFFEPFLTRNFLSKPWKVMTPQFKEVPIELWNKAPCLMHKWPLLMSDQKNIDK